MTYSPYNRRPARTGGGALAPLRWLLRLHPLQSWLVVMAVVIGLSMIGLRFLGLLVAVAWTGYAAFTWFRPTIMRRLAQRRWNRY